MRILLAALMCASLPALAWGQASAQQQELLAQLDEATAGKCLELAAKVKGYRSDVEAVRSLLGGKKPADLIASAEFVKAAEKVLQLHGEWAKLPEKVQQYLKIREVVDQRILKADKDARAAVFDPNLGLNEVDFRARAQLIARAEAAVDLADAYRTDILARLEALKDPAQLVRKALQETIRQHVQQPLKITKDLQIYFTPNDEAFTRPPFSDGAGLTIVLKYQSNLEVKVKGLYFRHENGAIVPKFDRMEKPDLGGLLSQQLRSLGSLIPLDLGCGITLKNVSPPDLSNPMAPDAGALKFDISLGGFMDSILGPEGGSKLVLEARGCKIFPSGRVVVTELAFRNETLVIPIGATPLTMIGYSIAVQPENKAFSVGTKIAVGPTTEGVYLDVTLASQLPLTKGVTVKGKLKIAGGQLSVGDVEGSLTPQALKVKLDVPGDSPLAVLASAKLETTMDRQGLTASGDLLWYSIINANFHMHIAPDGSGRFSGDSGNRDILGVRAKGEITGDFDKGFKNLEFRLEAPVTINLGGLLQNDTVIVNLKGTGTQITCSARGFGRSIGPFPLNPGDNLQRILEQEFGRVLEDAMQSVLDALEQADPFNKNSLAGKVAGNAKQLDPFNKDSAVRRAADELNPAKAGSIASKFLPKLDPSQGPLGDLFRTNGINIPAPGGFIDGGGGGLNNIFGRIAPVPAQPRFLAHDWLAGGLLLTTLVQGGAAPADADADFANRLTRLVVSLQDVQLREFPASTSSQTPKGRSARSTSYTACVLAPTMAAVDDKILIGFVVKTSGHGVTIKPRGQGKSERLSGSEISGGSIVLSKDPAGKGRWKGKLNMPKLAWEKYSYIDPVPRLRQKLEDLIEFHLPMVDVDGPVRRMEKHLVLNNATKEKLLVHLQRRTMTRVGDKIDWVWLPAEPPAAKSFSVALEPGQKALVTNKLLGTAPDKDSDKEFSASRVRVWAESGAGERWLDHQDEDLWLVDKNPQLKNDRAYVAEAIATFTHGFRPQSGMRTYVERTVSFKNNTDKKLAISLDYYALENGNWRWRSAPDLEVGPKATVQVRGDNQLLLRARALKFKATSPELAYQLHWSQPLWIVDAVEGRRVYRAAKIGNYLHTFELPD